MYNSNNYQQSAPRKRDRYYRDLDGSLFKTIIVGFHMETGEQLAALRRVEDGTVWFIPATDLKKRVLVYGVPTYMYTEDFTYQDDQNQEPARFNQPIVRQDAQPSNPYPGYTNDPRPAQPTSAPVTPGPQQQRVRYNSHNRYRNNDDSL